MTELVDPMSARFTMRITDEVGDVDLDELLLDAQGLVERYLTYPIIERWPDYEDVPREIPRAVMVVALDLLDNRRTPLKDMDVIRNLIGPFRRESF